MKKSKFKVMEGALKQTNKDIVDYDDIETPKVDRKDGLATVEDIKGLIKEVLRDRRAETPMPSVNISVSMGTMFDKMGETVSKLNQKSKSSKS